MDSTTGQPDLEQLRQEIASGDPLRAMPALAKLRDVNASQAAPLLLVGSRQQPFLVRSLSCSGLGVKRTEEGWCRLRELLYGDEDANVRAEAANALASFGVERSWPLLRKAFHDDSAWLVRCSILSALAEQEPIEPNWLLELAEIAVGDADGTVRVSGAEILGRLLVQRDNSDIRLLARALLQRLQKDIDHRVVAAALNGLQNPA
ncbi:hypothetical protein OMCYN_00617 [cyanobiont of Ornithocercus magnificus]|nr:hypothetical protein OMCYN_00617 [cyanobiont of Ornithocercus magnificus]